MHSYFRIMSKDTDANWHVRLDGQNSGLGQVLSFQEGYDASPLLSFQEGYDASPVVSFQEGYDASSS